MTKIKVPLFDLKVTDQDLKLDLMNAFSNMLDHGKFFMGPEIDEFESNLSEIFKTKYVVGLGSGSSALYIALKASGIEIGDEVITTPLSWIITGNAILACGATPVFADVLDDFNIDPESIKKLITKKTKAIVPMHYAGHMCKMDVLQKIANDNNLLIIEDAAQSFGAQLKGKRSGTFSSIGAFSLNPMKTFGALGEAGFVITENYEAYEKIKMFRHAGTKQVPKSIITNDCHVASLNHKMDTINATALNIFLKYFDRKFLMRQKIAKIFDDELKHIVELQGYLDDEIHGRYVYPVKVKKRNNLKAYLQEHSIETKVFNIPLVCDDPIYSNIKKTDVKNARRILDESIVIPSHEKLSEIQINYVIDKIKDFYKRGVK